MIREFINRIEVAGSYRAFRWSLGSMLKRDRRTLDNFLNYASERIHSELPASTTGSCVEHLCVAPLTEAQMGRLISDWLRDSGSWHASDQIKKLLESGTGGHLHYSQEGEDIWLDRYFAGNHSGFYVDVGAHHPFRFSNTFLLNQKGWRGINIDPVSDSIMAFREFRPQDINLEIAIGRETGRSEFWQFSDSALSTLDPLLARTYISDGHDLRQKKQVPVQALCDVLDQWLPTDTSIDLMSIDAEGRDLDVLKSNNWHRYCPQILVVESMRASSEPSASRMLDEFLYQLGFKLVARFYNSLIFQSMNWSPPPTVNRTA